MINEGEQSAEIQRRREQCPWPTTRPRHRISRRRGLDQVRSAAVASPRGSSHLRVELLECCVLGGHARVLRCAGVAEAGPGAGQELEQAACAGRGVDRARVAAGLTLDDAQPVGGGGGPVCGELCADRCRRCLVVGCVWYAWTAGISPARARPATAVAPMMTFNEFEPPDAGWVIRTGPGVLATSPVPTRLWVFCPVYGNIRPTLAYLSRVRNPTVGDLGHTFPMGHGPRSAPTSAFAWRDSVGGCGGNVAVKPPGAHPRTARRVPTGVSSLRTRFAAVGGMGTPGASWRSRTAPARMARDASAKISCS